MTLVNGKTLLNHAKKNNFAIPAFGFVNLEEANAIVSAAEKLNSPIILQTTEGGINYGGHEQLAAIAHSLANKSKIPIVLHLDHGKNIEYHKKSLKLGYTSLMIDGSLLSFEKNIEITKKVLDLVKDNDISIEAELGIIGGKEDDIEQTGDSFTDLNDAIKFVKTTNVDMLAIACGTVHGFYKKEPKINYKLIKKVSKQAKIPIVLHGGSDIPLKDIKKAINCGVRKVNFDSELKKVFIQGIIDYINANPSAYDIRKIFQPAISNVETLVKEKILSCNAQNKNWL